MNSGLQEKGMVELSTYFNNVAEFAKLNDIDCFDTYQFEGDNHEEHFIRGLLINLEFLALKWSLIDPAKYAYRKEERNVNDAKLPPDAYIQCFFDLRTFKLA